MSDDSEVSEFLAAAHELRAYNQGAAEEACPLCHHSSATIKARSVDSRDPEAPFDDNQLYSCFQCFQDYQRGHALIEVSAAFDAKEHAEHERHVKQELGRLAAANICPVCGNPKNSIADRRLKQYVPGQEGDGHLLSCKDCYDEINNEVPW